MKKKWLVCSAERSGTELLIASLIKVFHPELWQPDADRQVSWDIDGDEMFCDPRVMAKYLFEFCPTRSTAIHQANGHMAFLKGSDPRIPYKSHHAFDFFEPIWDRIKTQFNVIYIFRDPRDVMTSMWHHGWDKEGFMPRAFNVKQFIEMKPTEEMGRYHGNYRTETIASRWQNHLQSWRSTGVYNVSYEQLVLKFADTMSDIADTFDIDEMAALEIPGLTGVNPWKGKVGNWRNYWNCTAREDLEIFRVFAGEMMDYVELWNVRKGVFDGDDK